MSFAHSDLKCLNWSGNCTPNVVMTVLFGIVIWWWQIACSYVEGDKLIGDASRLVVAEACIHALDLDCTKGQAYEINSVEVRSIAKLVPSYFCCLQEEGNWMHWKTIIITEVSHLMVVEFMKDLHVLLATCVTFFCYCDAGWGPRKRCREVGFHISIYPRFRRVNNSASVIANPS